MKSKTIMLVLLPVLLIAAFAMDTQPALAAEKTMQVIVPDCRA